MNPRTVIVALCTATAICRPLCAQDTTRTESIAMMIGEPSYAGHTIPELTTIGIEWTHVGHRAIGTELAFGTAPYSMPFGVIIGAARAGLVASLPLGPDVVIMPSAGGSAIGASAGAVAFGVYAGVGMAYWGPNNFGYRAKYTLHRFDGSNTTAGLIEAGIAWRF